MTMTHQPHEHASVADANKKDLGLSNLETAEKRRRIAEIVWLAAQSKAKVSEIEAALEKPTILPRESPALKLQIADIAHEIATLRYEQSILKCDLAEDKARFPR